MPETRGSNRRADESGRRESLSGGYYWFPTRDHGSVTWRVLTCHELGFADEVGHDAMWPTVIERLAEAWGRDGKALRLYLMNNYTGLPRGRVTEPRGRFLICHGRDAPVRDWLPRVIRRFDLDPRSVRAVFDEHERTLPEDRRKVNEVLGIGPSEREDR